MKIFIILALCLGLTACQTNSTYFHPESELVEWGLQKHVKALREPSLFTQQGSNKDKYRLIVFSGVTPIHSIRLNASDSHAPRLTLTRLTGGYRLAKRPGFKSQKTKLVPQRKMDGFRKQLARQDFLNLESPPISGDTICLHPTIFQFESLQDRQYHDFVMSVCSLSIEGVTMVKVFYDLAGIDMTNEWSLSEYFSEEWEKPEYQNLLGGD